MEPRPEKGFHWPYYLFIPARQAPNSRLIVLGPNNLISSDLSKLERELRSWFHIRPSTTGPAGNLYTHALSREALVTEIPNLQRIDLQTLAMVSDAVERMDNTANELADDKFSLIGYSAGADFAQRLTILHPERVIATAVGGIGGMPTLPIGRVEGRELTYPVGIGDIEQLTGQSFLTEEFRQTPLLLIQGSKDDNDSVGSLDSYTPAQSELIDSTFGPKPIDRIEAVSNVFDQFKMDRFEFRVHTGDGHRITPRFRSEVVEWLSPLRGWPKFE